MRPLLFLFFQRSLILIFHPRKHLTSLLIILFFLARQARGFNYFRFCIHILLLRYCLRICRQDQLLGKIHLRLNCFPSLCYLQFHQDYKFQYEVLLKSLLKGLGIINLAFGNYLKHLIF